MKKIILTGVAIAALLSNAHAESNSSDFSFSDMFKDMKEAALAFSSDAKETVISMKDGAVETSKSAERTVTSVIL